MVALITVQPSIPEVVVCSPDRARGKRQWKVMARLAPGARKGCALDAMTAM